MSEAVSQEALSLLSAQWRPRANPWLIAAAVMTATFMEILDTTVVNVALPHIAGSLSVTPEESTWALTSYLVANAIVLPATGWLSNFFGRKRFLISCIILFTVASAACGAATTLPMLIVARCIQGAGGGALQPISQAVLLESFPPHKRGVAMAVFGLGVVVAPIIGPTLGGWLTDNYSWRWVFYVNLPVGLLAISLAQLILEDPPWVRHARRSRIDYIGFGLLALWIGSLQIVLDKGQQEDWLASRLIRALVVIGGVTLLAFLVWEIRNAHPLVNLRAFKDRNFTTGTALITVVGAVLYGSIALLPLFLQTLMGYSAVDSGLTLSPRGFGSIAGMILIGRIIGIIDNRMLIAIGFAILGYSTALLGGLNLQVAPSNVVWPNIINGFATAMIFVPLTTLTMGTLPNEQMGNATGIFNLMRNLGGGIGIAAVTTLLSRDSQAHQALMIAHLTPYDPQYVHHLKTITAALTPHVGSHLAAQQANALVYGQLQRQTHLWAYMDNFRLMAIVAFACIPTLIAFKRSRHRGSVAAH